MLEATTQHIASTFAAKNVVLDDARAIRIVASAIARRAAVSLAHRWELLSSNLAVCSQMIYRQSTIPKWHVIQNKTNPQLVGSPPFGILSCALRLGFSSELVFPGGGSHRRHRSDILLLYPRSTVTLQSMPSLILALTAP